MLRPAGAHGRVGSGPSLQEGSGRRPGAGVMHNLRGIHKKKKEQKEKPLLLLVIPRRSPGKGTEPVGQRRFAPTLADQRSRSSVPGVHVPGMSVHVRRNAHREERRSTGAA